MHEKLVRGLSTLIANTDRTYAEIFMQLRWVPNSEFPFALGVHLEKDELVFNPTKLDKLPDWFIPKLLQHEALHIILDHPGRMKRLNAANTVGNIAADLVVNQMVDGFPDSLNGAYYATIRNFRSMVPEILPDQTFEYYYKLFQQVAEDQMESISQADGHGDPKDGEGGASPEHLEKKAKQLVSKAAERAKNAGFEPTGQLRELIGNLLTTKTDWKRELRRFPQDAEVVSYVAHRFKRNRKFGYAFPGYKPERAVKIAVAVDLSGSIGDDIKDQFCHELNTIHNNGCEIEVIFFDDKVTGVETFTPATLKKQWRGGGGTLFQPAIDKAEELKVDGLVFLTDGCNFDKLVKPKIPVLWGILDPFEFNQPFGRHIMLTPEKT